MRSIVMKPKVSVKIPKPEKETGKKPKKKEPSIYEKSYNNNH